jgi:hypothetical protein
MLTGRAAHMAAGRVREARNGSAARYRLAADFYQGGHTTKEHTRFGHAELSFLRWEIERGVLDPPTAEGGGSPWWRAINDELLRDKVEADLRAPACATTEVSSHSVQLWLEFSEPRLGSPGTALTTPASSPDISPTSHLRRANSPPSAS